MYDFKNLRMLASMSQEFPYTVLNVVVRRRFEHPRGTFIPRCFRLSTMFLWGVNECCRIPLMPRRPWGRVFLIDTKQKRNKCKFKVFIDGETRQRPNMQYHFQRGLCESMKTSSSAIFLPQIFGISSPMFLLMNLWRYGLMTSAIPLAMNLILRKLIPSGAKPTQWHCILENSVSSLTLFSHIDTKIQMKSKLMFEWILMPKLRNKMQFHQKNTPEVHLTLLNRWNMIFDYDSDFLSWKLNNRYRWNLRKVVFDNIAQYT